jgi:hypothetical protein
MSKTGTAFFKYIASVTMTVVFQSTAYSANDSISPLSPAEKLRVQELLRQISTHLQKWPHAFKEGRTNIAAISGLEGVSESDLQATQAAYRDLAGMGKKVLPELITGLGDRTPSPYPTAEVESLIFDLEGQPMVIEYIANGKLKPTGYKAVENMFDYDDWRRTWFLPLFSSNFDSARELAYKYLPQRFTYCWEDWETHDKTQPMIDLYIKAAQTDKTVGLRKSAIAALVKIYEVIRMNEEDRGFRLQLAAYIEEKPAPGETIGDAGKKVSAWRDRQKPKREAQKELIARTLCDMLEHDKDVDVRRECAMQLRKCKEPFVEQSIAKGAKDADAQVKDECALFFMKQAREKSK